MGSLQVSNKLDIAETKLKFMGFKVQRLDVGIIASKMEEGNVCLTDCTGNLAVTMHGVREIGSSVYGYASITTVDERGKKMHVYDFINGKIALSIPDVDRKNVRVDSWLCEDTHSVAALVYVEERVSNINLVTRIKIINRRGKYLGDAGELDVTISRRFKVRVIKGSDRDYVAISYVNNAAVNAYDKTSEATFKDYVVVLNRKGDSVVCILEMNHRIEKEQDIAYYFDKSRMVNNTIKILGKGLDFPNTLSPQVYSWHKDKIYYRAEGSTSYHPSCSNNWSYTNSIVGSLACGEAEYGRLHDVDTGGYSTFKAKVLCIGARTRLFNYCVSGTWGGTWSKASTGIFCYNLAPVGLVALKVLTRDNAGGMGFGEILYNVINDKVVQVDERDCQIRAVKPENCYAGFDVTVLNLITYENPYYYINKAMVLKEVEPKNIRCKLKFLNNEWIFVDNAGNVLDLWEEYV